jgi:hypothetical protein
MAPPYIHRWFPQTKARKWPYMREPVIELQRQSHQTNTECKEDDERETVLARHHGSAIVVDAVASGTGRDVGVVPAKARTSQ